MLSASREWRSEHAAAWSAVNSPAPHGLSLFQRECERQIEEALSRRGLGLRNRVAHTKGEAYITASVPELGAELWIYLDQTEIRCPAEALNLEAWDTKTPEEHYERVVGFLESQPLVAV